MAQLIENNKGAWLVELLRLTAFPSPGAQIDGSQWWPAVVREQAESRLVQPKKGTFREEGPVGTGRLILEMQPARIDWVLSKPPDEDALGELAVTVAQFTDLMGRWLDLCGPVQRLAFGSILGLPVNSRAEGYERLHHFLKGIQLEAENSSDFLYQINRPRMFDSNGLQIKVNRLSKWSVALWQMREISVVSDRLITSRNTCHLELDINTDAEFQGELPRQLLKEVFRVLVEYAMEISQRGDVP